MSMFHKTARAKASAARKPSGRKTATVNRAGGVAFEVSDPANKLVTMTGGSFFAEPKFYSADGCIPKRAAGGKFEKMAERLELVDSKLKGVASCDELNDVAKEVLATAVDVASSNNPEDLLAIANWLRNEANIRLTPQVLLVLASKMEATKTLVRKYAPAIVKRPDEVKICLLTHRFFFGLKSLANGLANGLADAVSKFGERGLMKYDGVGFPSWKDVLCWLPRKAGWPLPNEVAKYFVTGKVVDPVKTPVISTRKEMAKCKTFGAEAQKLAKESMANWEVVLSQFPADKKKVWSFLVQEKLVGYMALLRNLRNILEARVGLDVIQEVSRKISSKDEVVRSKQLPFRFLSARRSLQEMSGQFDMADLNELSAAVELASNEACVNVPTLPGVTVIFADNSGSMRTNKVSQKSTVSCADAANVLCGIVAKVAERPYVCAFGTDVAPVKFTKNDTVLGIADKVGEANTHGCSTNTHRCIEWLVREGLTPDRVIFLSDMQAWTDGSCNDQNKCVADEWPKYLRQGGKAKDTWVHCIHLNGYGDSMMDAGARVNQVAGFSEKVFTMLSVVEGLGGASAVPTVEQIRAKWSIK